MSAVATRAPDQEATTPGPAPVGRDLRSPWWPRLLWGIGLVVAAAMARAALPDLRAGIDALANAHAGLLVAAVGLEIVALATLPLTFRAALAMLGGHVSYRGALRGALGAFALSRVVPAGGLAGGLYATRRFIRDGNNAAVSGAAVAVAGAVTMLTLGAVVTGGAVAEAATGRGSVGLVWSVTGFIVMLAGGGVVLYRAARDPDRLDAVCDLLARLLRRPTSAGQWRAQMEVVVVALAQPRKVAAVAGWSTLNWAQQLLALWMIFAAFGVAMRVGVLVLGFAAANVVTALPHTPGGLGVVEAGMTATYVAMGVSVPTALVGVLCYRLLDHWLPVLAALPLVLHRGRGGGLPSAGSWRSPAATDVGC